MNNTEIVVSVQNKPKWALYQSGQFVIAVGLISLVFNYAYRFAVDWSASGAIFYLSTFVLALISFVALRKDYIFVSRFEFRESEFIVRTLFGVKKVYASQDYQWVPTLHKAVNFPEKSANLSFHVKDRKTGKSVRNYSWDGFAKEDFEKVSQFYGYRGETDFKQKDFGRA